MLWLYFTQVLHFVGKAGCIVLVPRLLSHEGHYDPILLVISYACR